MNGFEKRALKIKEKIKKTTIILLSTMEPRNMRISDIAEAAKVSQVTIYKYFGSKEELINEALKSFYVTTLEEYEDFMKDPAHTFHDMIEYIMFHKKSDLNKISGEKLQELLVQNEEIQEFVTELYKTRTLPLFMQIIERGKERGEINQHLPASLIIFYLDLFKDKTDAMIQASSMYKDKEKFVEDITTLFFYGVAGKPEKDF
ncbi:TetR/AcrR family transcriptional regulator [Metabacillus sp. HB246100]|uniref:TetR/AcrR family transcriptional regulator n=1 Tax=Bacillus weihaiensis TaxID=1547283 RepID=UPI0023544843|nr:TetR/AcrR family transcriptional regulator [Bacillus weihaiensis]